MVNFFEVIFKILKILPLFEMKIKKNTFLFEENLEEITLWTVLYFRSYEVLISQV
jgi:hypothetical protein